MANVYCDNTDCIYCSQYHTCLCVSIWIGDEFDGGCREYLDYRKSEIYHTEYWKAFPVKGQQGKFERRQAFGKRIIINEREFFIEDNPNFDDDRMKVTDGETGAYISSISILKEKWDTYMKAVDEFKKNYFNNVMELPIADGR